MTSLPPSPERSTTKRSVPAGPGVSDAPPGRRAVPLLSPLLAVCLVLACGDGAPPYDVVVRGGTVVDGTGDDGRPADVALAGDRVAAVEDDIPGSLARRTIDATGLVVAPGFVNAHSWATGSLLQDGRSLSDLKQGVTTEVFGEGVTMGPLNDRLRRRLATVRDRDYPPPGYDISWTTLGEYLEHLEAKGVTPNVASFVGATTIRRHVLGDEDRAPEPEELDRMRALVDRAMRDGALGVGSRLAYAPASYADRRELVALARAAAAHGGRYISHIRSEGDDLLEGVEEFLEIARRAAIPATIYHLKAAGSRNWPKLDSVVSLVEGARAQDLEVTATMYPYRAGSTGLDACIPPWAHEGGADALRERLRDADARRRIAEDMRVVGADWENYCQLSGSPENVVPIEFGTDSLVPLQGLTLAEIAERRGTGPQETVMDLVLGDDGPVQTVFFLMSEENVRRQVRLPWVFFGSDEPSVAAEGEFLRSRVHPRAYGTFARVLGRYVRDEGLLSLEEAVRRMTSLPADELGLEDRGRLQPGRLADVVVFDAGAIADRATYTDPHRYAVGVEHVFVNGVQVLSGGEHTGRHPGRALRLERR